MRELKGLEQRRAKRLQKRETERAFRLELRRKQRAAIRASEGALYSERLELLEWFELLPIEDLRRLHKACVKVMTQERKRSEVR